MKRILVLVVVSILAIPAFAASWETDFIAGVSPEVAEAYTALGDYDETGRKQTVGALAPESKSALWKMNLAIFVAGHPNLTTEQRSAIEGVAAHLTPELYDRNANADRTAIDARIAHAKEVLTADMFRQALQVLGGPYTPNAKTALYEMCNCNSAYASPWCPTEYCNLGPCVKIQDGCGPAGLDGCNRLCNM